MTTRPKFENVILPSSMPPGPILWRGTTWKPGCGGYYPTKPLVSGTNVQDAHVWFSEEWGCWCASIEPSPACKARQSSAGSLGATPWEALDAEVLMWLRTVLALPGAAEICAMSALNVYQPGVDP